MPIKNELSNRYGKLVVIEFDPNKKTTGKAHWLCQCDCGNTTIVSGKALRDGLTNSCGCLVKEVNGSKFIDLMGQRFGKLLVVEKTVQRKGTSIAWKCLCDCGVTSFVSSGSLRIGDSKSCGCSRKNRPIYLLNNLYAVYKSKAKARELAFNLSKGRFKKLISDNCYYCGKKPSSVFRVSSRRDIQLIYNGIDRLNNKAGYSNSNCVTCCEACNRMKFTHSQKDFYTHISKIFKYSKLK